MLSPSQVIDEYYLEVRCKVLEIAAILDRYERAVERQPDQAPDKDSRMEKCCEAIAILNNTEEGTNRAATGV